MPEEKEGKEKEKEKEKKGKPKKEKQKGDGKKKEEGKQEGGGKDDRKEKEDAPPAAGEGAPDGGALPAAVAGGMTERERRFVEGQFGGDAARRYDALLADARKAREGPKATDLDQPDEEVSAGLAGKDREGLIEVLKREMASRQRLKASLQREEAASEAIKTELKKFVEQQRKVFEQEDAPCPIPEDAEVPTLEHIAVIQQRVKEKGLELELTKLAVQRESAAMEEVMMKEMADLADVAAALMQRTADTHKAWDQYVARRGDELAGCEQKRTVRLSEFDAHIQQLVKRTHELQDLVAKEQASFCAREDDVLQQEHKMRKYTRALGLPMETPRRPPVGIGNDHDSEAAVDQVQAHTSLARRLADMHTTPGAGYERPTHRGGRPALADNGHPSTYVERAAPRKKVAGVLGYLSKAVQKAFPRRRSSATGRVPTALEIERRVDRMEAASERRARQSPSYKERGSRGHVSTFEGDPEEGFRFPMPMA